jgi:hypothetical protein
MGRAIEVLLAEIHFLRQCTLGAPATWLELACNATGITDILCSHQIFLCHLRVDILHFFQLSDQASIHIM